jgi:hypothetical protein
MTVRANDLALFHLGENVFPVSLGEAPRDLECFVAFLVYVIELEHYGVALTTVDARVSSEVLEEKERALNTAEFFLCAGLLDVASLVGQVVLTVIGRVARSAHVVALALRAAAPREVAQWFALAAPATSA